MKKRYKYNLTHNVATYGYFSRMVPTCCLEVAPGDTFSGKQGLLVRLAALKRALLTDIFVDNYFFYVPHRLVWASWEDFLTDGPMDNPNFRIPTVTVQGNDEGSAFPYLRYFTDNDNDRSDDIEYSALRLRAYNLIYNEYFRDDDRGVVGPDNTLDKWGHRVSAKKNWLTTLQQEIGHAQPEFSVDTTDGSASAIEILRALAQQKIAIRRSTYGTRYVDVLRGYGVNVNYQMLQRPELLGMSRGVINVTDVVNTGDDLGTLAGHGLSGSRLTIKRKSFPEHGTLMGISVIRPQYHLTGGVDWFDRRCDYKDYYDPGLVPMPPTPVDADKAWPWTDSPNQLMGYAPYYSWYRSHLSWHHPDLSEWIPDHYSKSGDKSPTYSEIRDCRSDYQNSIFRNGGNGEQPEDRPPEGHYQIAAVNKLTALRLIPRQTGVAFEGST